MALNIKPLTTALAVAALSFSLQGCVAAALAPTALSLAAEGMSVHSTGKTITENLKEAILENKGEQTAQDGSFSNDDSEQVASLQIAPIPPRKPTPPSKGEDLTIKAEARTIGDFIN